jgi:hypothetical protein
MILRSGFSSRRYDSQRGIELMYQSHLLHTPLMRSIHGSSIMAAQAQALDRRRALDAQQRALREAAATRLQATPVRRRPS